MVEKARLFVSYWERAYSVWEQDKEAIHRSAAETAEAFEQDTQKYGPRGCDENEDQITAMLFLRVDVGPLKTP